MKIYTDWHKSLMPAKNGQASTHRSKCIIIDDSHSNFYGRFDKKSAIITARNPWKKDDHVLDYEMDSEDEWAE